MEKINNIAVLLDIFLAVMSRNSERKSRSEVLRVRPFPSSPPCFVQIMCSCLGTSAAGASEARGGGVRSKGIEDAERTSTQYAWDLSGWCALNDFC